MTQGGQGEISALFHFKGLAMFEFPALRNTMTGTIHLFDQEWCRTKFKTPMPGVYVDETAPRDEAHTVCEGCNQPLKITDVKARFTWHGETQEADVINPGDWWAKCHLVYVADCMSPPLFIVEASSEGSAEEEFVSNDRSKHMVEIDPTEYGDYANQVSEGDWIGGKEIDASGWLGLNGEFYDQDPHLAEPDYGPSGELYDDDNLHVESLEHIKDIRYFGVYEDIPLPAKGIRATNYEKWRNWTDNNPRG